MEQEDLLNVDADILRAMHKIYSIWLPRRKIIKFSTKLAAVGCLHVFNTIHLVLIEHS